MIGIFIPLYIQSNNKLDAWMRESREEMRDFHGKLISIEERRRKWGE
jgi:hypothetical protein